jgi:protein-L-isoaspartate(D-aspartate) O-methyltransferase
MTVAFLLIVACAVAMPTLAADTDKLATERHNMIRAIESDVAGTRRQTGRNRLDPRVMDVLASLPRHEFVPKRYLGSAYDNRPLGIGYGQTISQPYIVALMTDLLELESDSKILEVGTGSGYQAAVLAELVTEVYTIEIIPELGEQAAERFERLGYDNIESRIGDGYYGWPEQAPFDGVIVTAASSHVPPPLVQQLRPGGRMVIPVGGTFSIQHLLLITKKDDGTVRTKQILPVVFVPLTGEH